MIASHFPLLDCPACGADDPTDEVSSDRRAESMTLDELRPFWSGFHKEKVFFTYARCSVCGQMYAPHFFTPAQLAELYADLAPNMEDVTGPALEATQKGYWDAARAFSPPEGDYLEIGPDVGYIVRHAASDGRFDKFWLFEPNRAVHAELTAAAGDRPTQIAVGTDDLSLVADSSISLAAMIHVLDHLLDPIKLLRQIQAKLKPGGVIMIVTHNEKSLLRSIMGGKFPPFCLQHPELYNPASMSALLGRAGFTDVTVGRSTNYFPIAFMLRQAAWTAGVDLKRMPLPTRPLGVKLGNMITFAGKA